MILDEQGRPDTPTRSWHSLSDPVTETLLAQEGKLKEGQNTPSVAVLIL